MPESRTVSLSICLRDLDNTGLKLDERGRLTDWADRPSYQARPIQSTDGQKKHERTASEDQLLLLWCSAAEAQGVLRGATIFEQLESLRPSLTWRASDARWHKRLSTLPRALPPTSFRFAKPPDQDCHTDKIILFRDPKDFDNPQFTMEESDEQDLEYKDFQVGNRKTLLKRLSLESNQQFDELLSLSFVIDAYIELSDSLKTQRQWMEAELARTGKAPRRALYKSSHKDKIRRAQATIRAPMSLYSGDGPVDKSHWTDDDHEIRFIVRAAHQASLSGRERSFWQSEHSQNPTLLCERFFWLMLWLRWVYAVQTGSCDLTERVIARKAEWRGHLETLATKKRQLLPATEETLVEHVQKADSVNDERQRCSHDQNNSTLQKDPLVAAPYLGAAANAELGVGISGAKITSTCPPPEADRRLAEEQGGQIVMEPTGSRAEVTSAAVNPSGKTQRWHKAAKVQKPDPPQYSMPQAKHRAQQRGLLWLDEEGYNAYKNLRDQRLAAWGVTAAHSGTCVLIPQEWANIEPMELLKTIKWDSDMAFERSRLQCNLGDLSVAWARAVAWFESWPSNPRRGVDLDQLLTDADGYYGEIHGSHLCHHGLCVVNQHIKYESKKTNISRNACATGARVIRSQGLPVPEACTRHQPPCMMQHAALTAYETFNIQTDVLRMANDLPPLDPPSRPDDHPNWYSTFEPSLPTQIPLGSVKVNQNHLISSDDNHERGSRQKQHLSPFKFRCQFCQDVRRVYARATSYWSHIKILHPEIPHRSLLQEITRSAKEYKDWAASRTLDYQRDNPATWIKVEQALSANFSWDVVESWRLHLDGNYEKLLDFFTGE